MLVGMLGWKPENFKSFCIVSIWWSNAFVRNFQPRNTFVKLKVANLPFCHRPSVPKDFAYHAELRKFWVKSILKINNQVIPLSQQCSNPWCGEVGLHGSEGVRFEGKPSFPRAVGFPNP